MTAIVLTCDHYRALTEHMASRYAALWPGRPFRFRAACQQLSAGSSPGIEWRPCPVAIKATVLALLSDLGDEEWIYWCIDDKYPIALDLPKVEALARWTPDAQGVDGVLFCRCRQLLQGKSLTGQRLTTGTGEVLLERRGYQQIWLHQFLRAKVIRRLFESFPDEILRAKEMDELKKTIPKPTDHRLWVTRENLAIFGESTSRGRLTGNCAESFRRHGLALPAWHEGDPAESRIMGRFTWQQHLRAAWRKFRLDSGSHVSSPAPERGARL